MGRHVRGMMLKVQEEQPEEKKEKENPLLPWQKAVAARKAKAAARKLKREG
jgi:hypothetical protein